VSNEQSAERTLSNIRIVLVEPSHPGNIGGAARALKTMGLSDLALVNPGRYPDPQAEWRAAGAQDVLEATSVFASVDEAIADCHWVVGTSTRIRRIPWPLQSAAELAGDLLAKPEDTQIAILFGREASGLTNDELQKCHSHLQIPANPEYPSLNLAMAVQVVCYELCKQKSAVLPAAGWDRQPATSAEMQAMFEHFEQVLISLDFLDADNPGQTMTRLRRLFTRIAPDETEVAMLRGILKSVAGSK
jgi:tRNA (cytidine32/uridine32-2'-O)-methyltransferase